MLVKDCRLGANIFCFQEAAKIVSKLVLNVEIHYLTIGLWEQRVSVKVHPTTVTASAPEAIHNDAVLVHSNRSICAYQPAARKVAYTSALRFLAVSNSVSVNVDVNITTTAEPRGNRTLLRGQPESWILNHCARRTIRIWVHQRLGDAVIA